MAGPIREASEEAQMIQEIRVIKERRGAGGGFEVNQSGEAPEPLQRVNYTLVEVLNRPVTCALVPFIEARCSK